MKTQDKTQQGQGSAVSELEAISKRREEVITAVKQQLGTSLSAAAGHYKLLQHEGLQNILADPQYKDACEVLGIVPTEPQHNNHVARSAKRQNNRKGVSFVDAIKQSLADGRPRSVDDIYERVQRLKGEDASRDTMLAVLSVVRKQGEIKNPARGQWQKA